MNKDDCNGDQLVTEMEGEATVEKEGTPNPYRTKILKVQLAQIKRVKTADRRRAGNTEERKETEARFAVQGSPPGSNVRVGKMATLSRGDAKGDVANSYPAVYGWLWSR